MSFRMFIHGLDSSNKGTKSVFFREKYPTWSSFHPGLIKRNAAANSSSLSNRFVALAKYPITPAPRHTTPMLPVTKATDDLDPGSFEEEGGVVDEHVREEEARQCKGSCRPPGLHGVGLCDRSTGVGGEGHRGRDHAEHTEIVDEHVGGHRGRPQLDQEGPTVEARRT